VSMTTLAPNSGIPMGRRKTAKDDASTKWEESKHPRGQPENKGQFGPGGGGGKQEAPKQTKQEAGNQRQENETDKAFAKRVVDKRPPPKELPEDHSKYFNTEGSQDIPLEDLISAKSEEENAQGAENGAKRMEAASRGELSKRGPITVQKQPNGKYLITDGNGTYSSVKKYGWKSLPAIVENAQADYKPGVVAKGADKVDALKKPWAEQSPIKKKEDLWGPGSIKNQESLVKVAAPLAEKLGLLFVDPGIKGGSEKGKARIQEKIDEGKKTGKGPNRINDGVRAGFNITDPAQADKIAEEMSKHFEVGDEGWVVTDAGYFDRKLMVRFPDGQVGEVQIWHPELLNAKENQGHIMYEDWRTLRKKVTTGEIPEDVGKEKMNALENDMKLLYGQVHKKMNHDWLSLLRGSGGNEPNKDSNLSLDNSLACSVTSILGAFHQRPLPKTQASPGRRYRTGSPSHEKNLKPSSLSGMLRSSSFNVNTYANDEKITKVEARYTDGPTDTEPCKRCTMYRDLYCTAVIGQISPNGHCRLWEQADIQPAQDAPANQATKAELRSTIKFPPKAATGGTRAINVAFKHGGAGKVLKESPQARKYNLTTRQYAGDAAIILDSYSLLQKFRLAKDAAPGFNEKRISWLAKGTLPKIDTSHTVRWMSILSKDGETFYYDSSLPQEIENNGKKLDPKQPLIRHEGAEFEWMQTMIAEFENDHGRKPDDDELKKIYLDAHKKAGNKSERKWIEENGYDWDEWEAWCRGELSRLEHEPESNPPPDPDVKPAPHDRRNLESTGAQDESLKTLYVNRPLLNPDEFIAWAKSQGFKEPLKAHDLHVTIAFSKKPLDWSEFEPEGDIISGGGNRAIEKLGDKGAVCLKFKSDELQKRWKQFKDAGASWDWPSYNPHITITYFGDDVDLNKVEPYDGPLEFGLEKFAEVDENWADKVKMAKDKALCLAFDRAILVQVKTGRFIKSSRECMAFDSHSVRHYDHDGRLHVDATNISKATVNPYLGREIPDWEELGLEPDKIYQLLRDPEELAKAVPTFNNLPLLSKHVAVTAEEHPASLVIGSTGTDAEFDPPYLKNSLVVWPEDAIKDIESEQKKELSSAYRYKAIMEPGIYEGKKYDGVMTDIVGNHVALVREGRAGADVLVGDSKETITMPNARLKSRTAALAIGVLSAHLRPMLAKDAKLNLLPVFKGISAKNFTEKKPVVLDRLKKQLKLKPKIAMDATIGEVAELLDMIEAHGAPGGGLESGNTNAMTNGGGEATMGAGGGGEGMEEDAISPGQSQAMEKVGQPLPEALKEDEAQDDPTQEIEAFLQGKLAPEDIAKVCEMVRGSGAHEHEELGESEESMEEENPMNKKEEMEDEEGGMDAEGGEEKLEELGAEDEELLEDVNHNKGTGTGKGTPGGGSGSAQDSEGEKGEGGESESTKRMKGAADKHAKDKRMGKDTPPPFKGMPKVGGKMVTQDAMNAAIKSATDAIKKNARAVREAERTVKPWTGDLAMAFDTAEDVYRAALKMVGVEGADKLHPDALLPILKAQPVPGSRRHESAQSDIAMDEASVDDYADAFPDATRIGLM